MTTIVNVRVQYLKINTKVNPPPLLDIAIVTNGDPRKPVLPQIINLCQYHKCMFLLLDFIQRNLKVHTSVIHSITRLFPSLSS